ncbi:zeta toxin family protein [Corynebacterium nuruki]|uniref:zeta toxin family protein n=1 Tax=Corynebacterium nuruki TaxID=1032851 RepID=UPI0039BF306D
MTPVLHLLAGPNGAGKSTFVEAVLAPETYLPFVNADAIAAQRWPDDAEAHAYDASRLAADERARRLAAHESFITETVFSHPSKTDLVRLAGSLDYLVHLHVIMVPLAVSQSRVLERVELGGHSVPPDKVAERYERLWTNLVEARQIADVTRYYDNSSARHPFQTVAQYTRGHLDRTRDWPTWAPTEP